MKTKKLRMRNDSRSRKFVPGSTARLSKIIPTALLCIAPTRKGYINNLAEETYKSVMQFDVKLPNSNVPKPTSFNKASSTHYPQWFSAEDKERHGMLEFQTWNARVSDMEC
jgi:hypothetical protein